MLSGLFFLATILSYLHATTVSHASSFRRRWLCVALIFYSLSLLSKATGVTLPVVLLVLDVYPLRRLRYVPGTWWFGPSARPIWWEKVPFLVLAAAAAVIAPLAQHDAGAMASLRRHGLLPRLAQSSYGVVFYLWKTIWPTDLSGLYELPPNLNVLAWPFLLTGAVVVGITIGLFMLRHSWPAGLASWICYVIILAPVLGIIHHLVARSMVDRGDWDRAVEHFRKSIEIEPNLAPFHSDLGNALARQGRWDEAVENFQKALALNPNLSVAHFNLGNALALQGRFGEAAAHLQDALRIKPDYTQAYNNLGRVLAAQGQLDRAIDLFRRAVQIQPDFAEAHQSLAMALEEKGRKEEAVQELQEATRIMKSRSEAQAQR